MLFTQLATQAQIKFLKMVEQLELAKANVETSFYTDYNNGRKEICITINIGNFKCSNNETLDVDCVELELCFTEINGNHNVKLGYESYHNLYLDELKAHNDVYKAFDKIITVAFEDVVAEVESAGNHVCCCKECQNDRYESYLEDQYQYSKENY